MASNAEKTLTCLVGEYLAAARLCLKGYPAMLTPRNYEGVDILVYNSRTNKQIALQVKTISERGSFNFGKYPLPEKKLKDETITIWVHIKDRAKEKIDFFIAPYGEVARMAQKGHEKWYKEKPETRTLEGNLVNIIGSTDLEKFRDNWKLLEL